MYAEERDHDRKKQLDAKRQYIDIIEQKERELDLETNLTDKDIDEMLVEEKKIEEREMKFQIDNTKKLIEVYTKHYEKARDRVNVLKRFQVLPETSLIL